MPGSLAGLGWGAVAAHARSASKRRHTTIPKHMPSAHQRYASWTPARMLSFDAQIGPGTAALVETIMRTKPHPGKRCVGDGLDLSGQAEPVTPRAVRLLG
jgi:hypothetical protein